MEEKINRIYKYISSSGEIKDVRTLDYQYLVNAIAKAFRTMQETNNVDEFLKNSDNVCALHDEIFERNKTHFEEITKEN